MSQVLEREASGAPRPGAPAASTVSTVSTGKRKWVVPALLQIGAMIGIGALVYSSAADWFSTLNHNSEVSGYVEAVEQLPSPEREAKLELAREYNSHMPQGILRDPYSASSDENDEDAAYQSYLEVLRVSDNGVIGELSYPSLAIGLPIYHGTSDEVLSKGVGHLYGSSLPVGGPSTHTVLTSHSGLLNAALFTRLPSAELGDIFKITVLGETHYYEVDQLETVLPDQTDGLRIVSGEDYVTLITCTPIGINSHRMLVRGVRVEAPAETPGSGIVAGDGKTAGFPWWAIIFAAGSAASAYLLLVPAKPRRRKKTATSSPGRLAQRADRGGETC